jgi:hypothetical protein
MLDSLQFSSTVASIGGAIIAIYGVMQGKDAKRIQGWPSTTGVVRQSAVVESRERHAEVGVRTMYAADVRYDFWVDGREYRGRRLALMSSSASWRGLAERQVARFPIGHQVTVHYDPADPGQAILDRASAPRWAAAFIWLGLAVMVGGLAWPWLIALAA